jgi:hypothetical protein
MQFFLIGTILALCEEAKITLFLRTYIVPDGHHLAFLGIACECRSSMEGIEDYLCCLQVSGDRKNLIDNAVLFNWNNPSTT